MISSIHTYFRNLLILLLAFSVCACEDIIFDDSSTDVEEGVPVTIELPIALPKMEVRSRMLSDLQERHMTDLYIIAFNMDGTVEARRYYPADELMNHHEDDAAYTWGTVNFNILSGEYRIYGFANVRTNEYNDYLTDLDAVQNIDQLNAIELTLASPGNIERNQASLVMSGAFEYDQGYEVAGKPEGYCVVGAGHAPIENGKILLRRLDSRIRFNIDYDPAQVSNFRVTGWRVFNVPKVTSLLPLDADAMDSDDDYSDSPEFISVFPYEEGAEDASYFEFYMPENRKKSTSNITSYAEREREDKTAEGLNSGNYTYVEPNATFVEFTASMNIGTQVYAENKYVVHLGGVGGDFNDFSNNRNTKYTYNVRVAGVNDIVVEAEAEELSNDPAYELRPGAEGLVTEAEDRIVQLDCHYHSFIVAFSAHDMQEFKFIIQTPFNRYTQESANIPSTCPDITWLEFKRNYNNSSTALENHRNDSYGNLINITELAADVIDRAGSTTSTTLYYYTVFVKEYYYDEVPTGQNWSVPYWPNFVNQSDRYASLVVTPFISVDTESSYVKAKYHINQRSIQTYFSTTAVNEQGTALGLEYINETGVPSWGTVNTNYSNEENGYPNVYNAVRGNNWRTYFNATSSGGTYRITADDDVHGYSKRSTIALADCMSRNRDEDGDGVIDAGEIKWYMPSIDQLGEIGIGSMSLDQPLFDANSVETLPSDYLGKSDYHYMSSDHHKLWAEESVSTSGFSTSTTAWNNTPRNMRCVRDLGVNHKGNSDDEASEWSINNTSGSIYSYDATERVFTLKYLEDKSLRVGFIDRGELALHHNFQRINMPYKAFKIASGFTANRSEVWTSIVDISTGVAVTPCATYSEEADGSDIGTWRVPNQIELAIMHLEDPALTHNNGAMAFSLTNFKYDTSRYFGVTTGDGVEQTFLAQSGDNSSKTFRCVRDVQK